MQDHIELPKVIKKACINFENSYDYCFTYSIGRAIHIYNKQTLDHPERIKQNEQHLNDSIFSKF